VRGKTVNVVFGLDAEERDYEGYTGIELVYRCRCKSPPATQMFTVKLNREDPIKKNKTSNELVPPGFLKPLVRSFVSFSC